MGQARDGRSVAGLRARWAQLSVLSRVMLVLSVLTSALAAGVLSLVVYLFIGGYSGGNSPASVTPVLFPIALLLLVVAGLPSMVLCGAMWAGYSLSARSRRSAGGDAAAAPPGTDS